MPNNPVFKVCHYSSEKGLEITSFGDNNDENHFKCDDLRECIKKGGGMSVWWGNSYGFNPLTDQPLFYLQDK
ncbi:MAG: hypothetical protein Q8N55_03425 [bacterium]|nr:hypothetical protein [bacterium]